MDDMFESGRDLFTQDGVLLKSATADHIADVNTVGTLCIVEYQNNVKCIEWRPNDVLVDSDMQDQEWAVVNTIGQRTRTLSGSPTSTETLNRSRIIRIIISDIKGFKLFRNNQEMAIINIDNTRHCAFFFQHANADSFVMALKSVVKVVRSKPDRNMYLIMSNPELEVLGKSFAELDLFREHSGDVVWKFVRNLHSRPYETTLEAFSKLTDIVFYGNDPHHERRYMDAEVADLLSRSINAVDEATTTQTSEDYEVIGKVPVLPPRPLIHRGTPMSPSQWEGLQDSEGRILEVDGVKQIIFRGGVAPAIRQEVWKFLLNYQKWNHSKTERAQLHKQRTEEYFMMKLQWRTMTQAQENRFTDYQNRKSLIEKDVNRTDRTCPYYAGDDNPNLQILFDILMTYVMYNFDLGYVQGMSDLLSPILFLMENEVDAFWCFVGFMDKVSTNFDLDQAGMKLQLQQLHALLAFIEPELSSYLDNHDSGNMFFCFRWLLVLFKREFSQVDVMRLWEVLWTGLPCANFHLLMCAALLDSQKSILIENKYGFTEILKHINDLSQHIDLQSTLCKAEGIYHQLISASHLTDSIRIIIGLKTVNRPLSDDSFDNEITQISPRSNTTDTSSIEHVRLATDCDEVAYEKSINNAYL